LKTNLDSTTTSMTPSKQQRPLITRHGGGSNNSPHHPILRNPYSLIVSVLLFYGLIRCFDDVGPDDDRNKNNNWNQQQQQTSSSSSTTLSSSSSSASSTTATAAAGDGQPPGVLERLLLDAGLASSALLSRPEMIQLERRIGLLYGRPAVLAVNDDNDKDNDCVRYRSSVPLEQRQLAVAGMFNTGTNLLDNQLRKNIFGLAKPNLWQVPWYVFCFVSFFPIWWL
jgi:hypothetical protein